MSETELWKTFSEANIYIFFDHEPTKTWARRRAGKKGIEALGKKMIPVVEELARSPPLGIIKGLKEGAEKALHPSKSPMVDYGRTLAKALLKQGKSTKDVAWILISMATAAIANAAQGVRNSSQSLCPGYRVVNACVWVANCPTVRSNRGLLPGHGERGAPAGYPGAGRQE